jgi:hypothetical protein
MKTQLFIIILSMITMFGCAQQKEGRWIKLYSREHKIEYADLSNGDFIGTANGIPGGGEYQIEGGNTIYNVFGFSQNDTTGRIFIKNIKGIFKNDGSFRCKKFDLKIMVRGPGKVRTGHLIITIRSTHGVSIEEIWN